MDGGDAGAHGDDAGAHGDDAGAHGDEDVRATYDRIADHFASTREYPWPEVEAFLAEHGPPVRGRGATTALDLGCGNGRHAEVAAEYADRVVGADASRGLLSTAADRARERGFDLDLVQADAAALPFSDASFDLAVYVATLHHLRPRSRRVRSLDELARVVGPDGRAVVSAWSTAHDRFDADEGFDTAVDWTLPGGECVPRFYHIYDPDEFVADLEQSDLGVVETFVSSGNCYAVVTRS